MEVPITPRRLGEDMHAAVNARNWDALRSVFSLDFRLVDRRLIGWGELHGQDAYVNVVKSAVELSSDFHLEREPLVLGTRANVVRILAHGHANDGGGEWEIESLSVALIEHRLFSYFELFDGSNVDEALARFEEIGAQTEPERVVTRLCRSVNSRDWDAIEDVYTEDFESIDHRALGWEPMRGGRAIADFFRSWVDVVPDIELRFTVLAGDEEHAVVQFVGWGHAAEGGGEMEYLTLNAMSFRDGRCRRVERFEADDEALALARFEELRAERP